MDLGDFEIDDDLQQPSTSATTVSGRPKMVLRRDKQHLKERDVQELLETLASGDVSDIDLEDSDDEEYNRSESLDDNDDDRDDDHYEDDTGISDSVHVEPINKPKKFTISWNKKKSFEPPDTAWKGHLKASEYDELPSPFSLLTKYYDNKFFELFAHFTNLYSVQSTGKSIDCDKNEMRQLFALHVIMGCLKYPQRCLYWDEPTRISIVADTMSRKRFFKLRTNLHVVDNLAHAPDNVDKFWKVRPMVDRFLKTCSDLTLEERLCVDEQMIPFKGKLVVKQYIKNKPCSWGIKVFVLCGESGLVHDLIIYQGSTTEYNTEVLKDCGLGAATVLKLAEKIPMHQNYKLFYDNYFSSLNLLDKLRVKGIQAAGTVRRNRLQKCPLPADKVLKKQERGTSEEITTSDGKIVIVSWIDNNPVLLASNFIGIGTTDIADRWDKKKKVYIPVTRPEIIQQYNKSMGGVDHCDQMVAAYRTFIKSRKWTLRVIFHFFDLAIVNAWFEYKKVATELKVPPTNLLPLLNFRMSIAEALMKAGIVLLTTKRGRPSLCLTPETNKEQKKKKRNDRRPVEDVRYDTVGHFPNIPDDGRGKRCKFEGCGKLTKMVCEKCKVNLCIVQGRNCFINFHVKL